MGAALALLDNFPQLLRSIAPVTVSSTAPTTLTNSTSSVGTDTEGLFQGTVLELLVGLGRPGGPAKNRDSCSGGSGADGGTIAHLGQVLLVLFSVCNTIGRIVAGFWPEQALHKHVRSLSRLCNFARLFIHHLLAVLNLLVHLSLLVEQVKEYLQHGLHFFWSQPCIHAQRLARILHEILYCQA